MLFEESGRCSEDAVYVTMVPALHTRHLLHFEPFFGINNFVESGFSRQRRGPIYRMASLMVSAEMMGDP